MSRLRRPDEVSEVVQEVFARVLTRAAKGRIERPRDYLFRVALNVLTDRARHRGTPAPSFSTTNSEQWADPLPCPRRVTELLNIEGYSFEEAVEKALRKKPPEKGGGEGEPSEAEQDDDNEKGQQDE